MRRGKPRPADGRRLRSGRGAVRGVVAAALIAACGALSGAVAAAQTDTGPGMVPAAFEAFLEGSVAAASPGGDTAAATDFSAAMQTFRHRGFFLRTDGFLNHPRYDVVADAPSPTFCMVSVWTDDEAALFEHLLARFGAWDVGQIRDWPGYLSPGPDPKLFVGVVPLNRPGAPPHAFVAAIATEL